ncbi:MAG: peptide deformylase [Pseudomonadota bacterium]
MAIREILQIGHPVLATRADEVDVNAIQSDEVQGWIDDMIDTMRDANGAGIAANQVGISRRLFTIEVEDNPRYPYKPKIPLTVVINPELRFLTDETFQSNEGCLSIPEIRAEVARHCEIAVVYYDRDGNKVEREIRGYSACTWQHEYDHLNGILFPHRVTDPNTFCSWSIFHEYKQAEFAKRVEGLVEKWGA